MPPAMVTSPVSLPPPPPPLIRVVLVGGGHAHCQVVRDIACAQQRQRQAAGTAARQPDCRGEADASTSPAPDTEFVLVSEARTATYSGMVPGLAAGQYRLRETQVALDALAARHHWRFLEATVAGVSARHKCIYARVASTLGAAAASGSGAARTIQLRYDILSIDVGSTTQLPWRIRDALARSTDGCDGDDDDDVKGVREALLAARPIQKLDASLRAFLAAWRQGRRLPRVAVVGSGAAGIELAFALHERIRRELAAIGVSGSSGAGASAVTLVASARRGGQRPVRDATWRVARRELKRRGIAVREDLGVATRLVRAATAASSDDDDGDVGARDDCTHRLEFERETRTGANAVRATLPCDVAVFATGAAPPTWLRSSTDLVLAPDTGFIRVRPTLQSVTADDVFAVGDCAEFDPTPTSSARSPFALRARRRVPKAGVYAVRQGPVLTRNLARMVARTQARRRQQQQQQLQGRRGAHSSSPALEAFRPQRDVLTLLNTADGRAIGSKFGVALYGRWLWRLKDRIDRAWMRGFPTWPPGDADDRARDDVE